MGAPYNRACPSKYLNARRNLRVNEVMFSQELTALPAASPSARLDARFHGDHTGPAGEGSPVRSAVECREWGVLRRRFLDYYQRELKFPPTACIRRSPAQISGKWKWSHHLNCRRQRNAVLQHKTPDSCTRDDHESASARADDERLLRFWQTAVHR